MIDVPDKVLPVPWVGPVGLDILNVVERMPVDKLVDRVPEEAELGPPDEDEPEDDCRWLV